MFSKKTLISALIAAGALGAAALPLPSAADDFGVTFSFSEPRPVFVNHEYWRRDFRHDGVPGTYRPTRWDRDGDGIPNRYDPTPDGFRPRFRDSDRDGVPDRFDRYPYDPRWR